MSYRPEEDTLYRARERRAALAVALLIVALAIWVHGFACGLTAAIEDPREAMDGETETTR